MQCTFHKYHGTGNDFIIIDNRHNEIPELSTQQVKAMCNRHTGIGADGLMLLQLKEGYHFEMVYYNADGNVSTMCGNGGRCLVQFAATMGIVTNEYTFIAIDGVHHAYITKQGWVHLKMCDVQEVHIENGDYILNTGSPHYVTLVSDIKTTLVTELGKAIRYSYRYNVEGINVNFVARVSDDTLYVRTYERGVEAETLSCGTGVTAAAIALGNAKQGNNTVHIHTLGGKLTVMYSLTASNTYEHIWLCGPAVLVYTGIIVL